MARKAVKGGTATPTIRITREAKDLLVDWLDANKKPEIGLVIDQLVRWFSLADPVVQQVVMNLVPIRVRKAYADALRQLADEIESGALAEPLKIAAKHRHSRNQETNE